jgi:hypothetical protein
LDALKDVPPKVLEVLQEEIQRVLVQESIDSFAVGRWNAAGIDGSKQNLPRTKANESHFGLGGKDPAVPQRLLVNVVALRSELLFDWASGKIDDNERRLALEAISRLPEQTLVVADAGFPGYDWIQAVLRQNKHILLRVGANVNLWATRCGAVRENGGAVWLWPGSRNDEPPLRLRLIRISRRVKEKRRRKRNAGRMKRRVRVEIVYLLTDVLDENKLTKREAGELYGKRWPANEGMFRNWKRTLSCEVVLGRTPKIADREFQFSMLAYMLAQGMVMLARKRRRMSQGRVSIAMVLHVWRIALQALLEGKTTRWFRQALSACVVDSYGRRGPKATREWPRRKKHKAFKGPKIRKLTVAKKTEGLRQIKDDAA